MVTIGSKRWFYEMYVTEWTL